MGVGNEQGPRVSQSPLEKPLGGGGGSDDGGGVDSDVCMRVYMCMCVSVLPAAVESGQPSWALPCELAPVVDHTNEPIT